MENFVIQSYQFWSKAAPNYILGRRIFLGVFRGGRLFGIFYYFTFSRENLAAKNFVTFSGAGMPFGRLRRDQHRLQVLLAQPPRQPADPTTPEQPRRPNHPLDPRQVSVQHGVSHRDHIPRRVPRLV